MKKLPNHQLASQKLSFNYKKLSVNHSVNPSVTRKITLEDLPVLIKPEFYEIFTKQKPHFYLML